MNQDTLLKRWSWHKAVFTEWIHGVNTEWLNTSHHSLDTPDMCCIQLQPSVSTHCWQSSDTHLSVCRQSPGVSSERGGCPWHTVGVAHDDSAAMHRTSTQSTHHWHTWHVIHTPTSTPDMSSTHPLAHLICHPHTHWPVSYTHLTLPTILRV